MTCAHMRAGKRTEDGHANGRTTAKTVAGLAAAVTLTGIAGAGLAELNATPANAAVVKVSPATRTCRAFIRWEKHQTLGRLETLVRDSLPVRNEALRQDVAALWFHHVTDADIDVDTQYIAGDCGLGGM